MSLLFLAAIGCISTAIVSNDVETDTADTAVEVDDGFTPVDNGSSSGSGSNDDEDDDTDTEDNDDVVKAYFADCDLDGVGGSLYVIASAEPTDATSCTGGRWETIGGDCNDNDCDVYPGATETDNDVDDDCDGSVDENLGTSGTATYVTYYADVDKDGYGSPTSTASATSQPAGYVTNDDDCNDSSASVSPADSEGSTADGVDNDCDGSVDEGTSSGGGSTTTESLVREVCVVQSESAWELAYIDEWSGDATHWVTYSGSTAKVDSPIMTGSDGSTKCVSITLEAADTVTCYNGYGSDSELWGKYLVGALSSGTYAYTSGSYAAEVEVTIDEDVNGVSDTYALTAEFDGYDLCVDHSEE